MTLDSNSTEMAIFCDFDGTFSVEDVGSTLARTYLPERRSSLWEKFSRGELDPWHYTVELLEGFDFSENETEAFLETISLDPGAFDLVRWCGLQKIPFRILSDGFDKNLDRIQRQKNISFEYDANHLEYEKDRWHISAGHPNAACGCGTGVCKKGRIQEFVKKNPGVHTVHIGNGRVSDLCASLFVDYVFAKETLAEELERQDRRFFEFNDLREVISILETLPIP